MKRKKFNLKDFVSNEHGWELIMDTYWDGVIREVRDKKTGGLIE